MAGSHTTIDFDEGTRDMLRALCHEYGMAAAQVVRQLVRAQYHALFPDRAPQSFPARSLDRDAGARLRSASKSSK
jgi:hypothetical protein